VKTVDFIEDLQLRGSVNNAKARKESAEKMSVSLPFGIVRRFWAHWKCCRLVFYFHAVAMAT
jgi:hypothetical protein